MKTTKILSIARVFSLIIALFTGCSPKFEPLTMRSPELVINRGNGMGIKGIIDFEASNIPDNADITVVSKNEEIATYKDNTLTIGNQYGETTVEFIVGNKKGTLKVKVVPYLEYMAYEASKEDAKGYTEANYLAAEWVIANLDAFKNPSSVSVSEVYAVVGDVTTKECNASFFIVKIRAQNGFGGNSVEYYKVNSYSISEVEIDTYDGLKYYYNGKLIDDVMMSYGVDKAVQEYIEENY